MPSNPWRSEAPSSTRSLLGSIRKLGRKKSNASERSNSSTSEIQTPKTPTSATRGPAELNMGDLDNEQARRSPSPLTNPSPATRRPDRPGMNAFTVPSNEPPPAYTPSSTTATGTTLVAPPSIRITELADSSAPPRPAPATNSATRGGEDPYAFLGTFDTLFLIDDSGSMAGRGWREVAQALQILAPIVTTHDSDGIDVYFMNHKSNDPGSPSEGIASGGYRGIMRADTVNRLFKTVRPFGGTPTGTRIHNILKPYLAKLETEIKANREMKPINLIVLTDGAPSDDVESVLISAAKKLDKLDAPPYQVGVQFFQVGDESGARQALDELDNDLSKMVDGGIRDIVDTVTWEGGQAQNLLTSDGILKALLGAVVKRLDRRRASGEVSRS